MYIQSLGNLPIKLNLQTYADKAYVEKLTLNLTNQLLLVFIDIFIAPESIADRKLSQHFGKNYKFSSITRFETNFKKF